MPEGRPVEGFFEASGVGGQMVSGLVSGRSPASGVMPRMLAAVGRGMSGLVSSKSGLVPESGLIPRIEEADGRGMSGPVSAKSGSDSASGGEETSGGEMAVSGRSLLRESGGVVATESDRISL